MSGEKTEQPTSKKLRDARQKGQVAHSKDFTQVLLVLALFGYLLMAGPSLMQSMAEMILLPAQLHGMPFRNALALALEQMMRDGALLLLPFLLIVLGIGIFGETLQVGILFAFESLKPSAKKLNVVDNLKNMFSAKNLVEFLKSCIKVVFLSALVYFVVRDALDPLTKLPSGGVMAIGLAVASLMRTMVINVVLCFGAIALADLAWQRYRHTKDLMMSKEEIKQEYKEMEGDPHIKGKRRHLAQEIAMGGGAERARKASVVVTNPTHFAVALYYQEAETPLPMVLAKGQDALAQRIVEVAREEGIPVLQNVPLARALYRSTPVDHVIPTDLIEPVAEVLRLVRQLAQDRLR
ncbi:type III secretion system export apparatus subunit SctU [Chitinimonas lacunae]|uniref:Type III secretion system export apparatus subunit SctU n=1 Tax=Chitinimonas lacunae TaxID=1963018 RepID=A0ABV8MST6_9NEIS